MYLRPRNWATGSLLHLPLSAEMPVRSLFINEDEKLQFERVTRNSETEPRPDSLIIPSSLDARVTLDVEKKCLLTPALAGFFLLGGASSPLRHSPTRGPVPPMQAHAPRCYFQAAAWRQVAASPEMP